MEQLRLKPGPRNTYWGLALAWYEPYTQGFGGDLYSRKMSFLDRYGMKSFIADIAEIDALTDTEQDKLFQQLDDRDMHIILHVSGRLIDMDFEEMKVEADRQLKLLDRYVKPCRSDIVTTCAADNHRYDRKWSRDGRIERYSRALSPIAAACWELGAPFALENHADYFVSDILAFMRETPRLYLLLDTANALHIGENPLRACEEAAPYVVGTHFKDHAMVKGPAGPLHYEITSCALGDGDAELTEQYRIITEKSPFRDKLVMLFEMFSPQGTEPLECFEKSVGFVKSLQEASFT